MNKKVYINAAIALIVLLILYHIGKEFFFYDVNDCILDYMPGTGSDKAASAIISACSSYLY